ncbi:MAG: SMC family ATPase [Anaerolineales bacterium]
MIPLHLKLSGFLSYYAPVEVDFSSFELACISGSNGAGKSSLLDAITWALFGQARKRDEAIVNLQSKVAEVAFTFAYENSIYRVIRSLPHGKGTTLEFQIAEGGDPLYPIGNQQLTWRPLTERTLRDTQARIEHILRLDYDTFVNVSFFLQGRADQFAQQPPTRRKEILGAILGLEVWDVYRDRAAGRRKVVERELDSVDGRVAEIEAELAEEEPRQAHLAELESQLNGLVASRKLQETALANVKQVRMALDRQRELVVKLNEALARSQENLAGLQTRLGVKESERSSHAELVSRADGVEASYVALQKARLDLEKWEQVAGRFREHDGMRQPLLREIESERARLEQERAGLEEQRSILGNQTPAMVELRAGLKTARKALELAEAQLAERIDLEQQIQLGREQWAALRSENITLNTRMEELIQRMNDLKVAEGVACPLCGQPLSPEHRRLTIAQLKADKSQFYDRAEANKLVMKNLEQQAADAKRILAQNAFADSDRMSASRTAAQLSERLESLQKQSAEWERSGAKRLDEVIKLLDKGKFALTTRKNLAKLDKELAALGYDAAAHDAARRAELQARPAEAEYRQLESARAALKPLDDEIANLESEIKNRQSELDHQQGEYAEAISALSAVEAQAPDLDAAERSLFDLQERENQLHQEVGAARQKVTVLADLRKRKKALESERGEMGLQIGHYKTLERAFGKDGVPALLIEQALPEIEMKANQVLGRLSEDSMHLHFETQARYKDEKRKELRETLEIQVSDGAGLRDYEMYSGGEAFRVNFAIRLALSEVLAHRKGARLQMLVIDEGFGSQDALGRQRLIQAINAVKADFAKILVITHLEELKDAFPTRIEVEKTEAGSTVVVI